MKQILPLLAAVISLSGAALAPAKAQDLYLVSLTADWCPNCRVLDPKMEAAMDNFSPREIEYVALDMTDDDTKLATFEQVNGTILAGVYGDHMGVTAIGIMTAADSGEKIGCVTIEHSIDQIIALLTEAREIVLSQPPGGRSGDLGSCPQANRKIAL